MQDVQQWITAITQNLIVAIAMVALAKLYSLAKPSISKVTGVAIPATKRAWPAIRDAVIALLVAWYLISQLRGSIAGSEPLNGERVAAIAFWMWWCLFYFVMLCRFDIFRKRPQR